MLREVELEREFGLTSVGLPARPRELADRDRAWTLLEMVRDAISSPVLATVLGRVSTRLAASVGASHCWFYLTLEGSEAGAFWADRERLPRGVVGAMESFFNPPLRFPLQYLALQALEHGLPVPWHHTQDGSRALEEDAQRLGVKVALAMPLILEDRPLGAAVLASFDERAEFSAMETELAWELAGVAARGIQNAWTYEKTASSAVAEERCRLSREMHDSLAQALSYLNLQAGAVKEWLERGEIDEARAGLSEIVRTAGESYRDLRESLFCLRASVPSGSRFLPALREYLEDYRRHYGLVVQVEVEDGSSWPLSERVGVQLSRIVLEALSNVRKHAKAGAARVRFHQEGGQGRVSVEDDGRGFEPGRVMEDGGSHFGLQIMRERAESVGGSLEVHSQVGRGTRVVVRVPLL